MAAEVGVWATRNKLVRGAVRNSARYTSGVTDSKLTIVAAVLHKEHGKEIDMVALCVLSLILETTKDDTFRHQQG